MQNKQFTFLFFFFIAIQSFAQQDGYWDKERATSKQVVVSARKRIIINTEDLPIGTTEVVFRITLLDENQQMANSLVSVLKAIPDPTGISQGSAGAVLLLSKISGEDKCKYAIFSNATLAADYKEKGTTNKACLAQNNPVNKDAKRLSINSSSCLKSNSMWFGFENKNWIMNQRIVLEVVPWVNTRLSSGWSLENRKSVLSLCKSTDLAKKIPNSDNYCVCILEKLQKEYRFNEYQSLLAAEKTKVIKDFGKACFTETGGSDEVYSALRSQASDLAKQKKYGEAIVKLGAIIENDKAIVSDFNAIGSCYILTKQYDKAIRFLKIGEKLDDSELLTKLNLAHAYLLNNEYSQAKSIYKKYQSQNVTDSLSWTQKVKQDFETFEKAGLPSEDFKRILNSIDN
ncbi:tetratricopeptide repeat protein [Flavobacterium psychrotolerans]|uniref:Uncharacterized protein n=1 Tax=Flavobacterium psychrotolerans TaxID=2169410 RepID=A0A2U1JGS3_9FLAO|nr:hypothetical protein [Flavobacterium psychrotolerans]PWA04209.1 hypothetical protein DB895_11990 [Flavobacterium psychrotolerans]